MKKPIAILLATTGIMVAFAETKTSTSANGVVMEKKYPWESSVTAGLSLARGNKNMTMMTADFLTKRMTPTDEYTLGLGGAYGEQNSTDTVNNYKAFGQWNHLFTERFYSYVRGEALRDVVADLDYRITIGPGVGYYFLKSTNNTLAAEIGGAFEAQHLGNKNETFATARLAERYEHKFNDHARFWQSAELLPEVDKLENYVINFEVGVEASLAKSFSLKTYLDDTYANRPADGHKKNDVKLVAGLSYKF